MNNIQKNFKNKSRRGIRAFGSGGLLDDFNARMKGLEESAASGGGFNSLPDTPSVASAMAEGQRNFDAGMGAPYDEAPEPSPSNRVRTPGRTSVMPSTGIAPDWRPSSNMVQFGQRAFAGGGAVDPVEQLLSQMKNKYGGVAPQSVAPAPQPVAPAPQPQRTAQPAPTIQGAVNSLRSHAAQLKEAAAYAHGGEIEPFVDGAGFIHGTPGIDKVPAQVAQTGENILVGDGERIVNQKQNKALEHLAQKTTGQPLDSYLEDATGQPVGPKVKKGIRAAAGGFFNDLGDTMANMVKSPDRRAMDAGTATPEQVERENRGMARAFATDSPYDAALPMAPMAGLRAAAPAGAGMVDSAVSAAKSAAGNVVSAAGDAVRGLRGMIGKKAATPAAEAIDNVAPIVAPEKWSPQAAEHLAQRSAQDKAFAAATTAGKGVATAGKEFVAAPAANAVLQSVPPAGNTVKPAATTPADPRTEAQIAAESAANNPNVRSLRAAGVTGDVGGDDFEWRKDAVERYSPTTGKTGIRTIDTANGKVYAGRDAKGQLNVTSNLGQTGEESEAARAKEADRINADLKRQTETFDRLRLESDMKSNNPADRASAQQRMGLRTLDAQIAQANQANETARRGQDMVRKGHQIDNQTKLATLQNQRQQQNLERNTKLIDDLYGGATLKTKDGEMPNEARRDFINRLNKTLGQHGRTIGHLSPKDMVDFQIAYDMDKDGKNGSFMKFYNNWIAGAPEVEDFDPFRSTARAAGDEGKSNALGFYTTRNGSIRHEGSAVGEEFLTGTYDINRKRQLDQ
jgi:hypothetical protein